MGAHSFRLPGSWYLVGKFSWTSASEHLLLADGLEEQGNSAHYGLNVDVSTESVQHSTANYRARGTGIRERCARPHRYRGVVQKPLRSTHATKISYL